MSHSHGGMDMSGMGGMDMASTGLFVTENKKIAHALPYLALAAAIVRGLRSLIDYIRAGLAKRAHNSRESVPSRPTNAASQFYETVLTVFRETSYPARQPFKGRFLRYFTPPPLGQSVLILTYWIIILTMLFTKVFPGINSGLYGYRWEEPAFRAAWVSITQVPLLYALSCKFNVISIITGISYERLNWMHRWTSRTLFLTVIVHWAYFFHEWTLADFVTSQIKVMPMVKYGFGAWAVIGWMVITGFGFFRDLSYELWVLQHLAGAGTLLWLLYVHVPSYAQYNVWLAVAFVVLDRGVRVVWALYNNLHLRAFGKGGVGYKAEAIATSKGYLRLTVKNVDFDWRAGQHVFLSIPTCGIFESHPFTIANTRLGPNANDFAEGGHGNRDMDIFFKCHTGFTGKLQQKARKVQEQGNSLMVNLIFLSGPWGIPPLASIEKSNALIFIASSTGASYNMSLLEHAIKRAPFVQRICFYWVVRHVSQIQWFDLRLREAMRQLASLGIHHVEFKIFVTGADADEHIKTIDLPADSTNSITMCQAHSLGLPFHTSIHGTPQANGSSSISSSSRGLTQGMNEKQEDEKAVLATREVSSISSSSSTSGHTCGMTNCTSKPTSQSPSFTYAIGRPRSFDSLIRPTIEAATGETMIVACGGKSMMASIRTYVAGLSDERAVHKGTGAQGIQLWTESYGW